MSETPKERRAQQIGVIIQHLPDGAYDDLSWPGAGPILDALLTVLEPPVADMVRRGVERVDIGAGHPLKEVGSWYRPRAES